MLLTFNLNSLVYFNVNLMKTRPNSIIFVYVSILFHFRTNPKRKFKTLSADVKNKS